MNGTYQINHNGQTFDVRIVSGRELGLEVHKPDPAKDYTESPKIVAVWEAAEKQGLLPGPVEMAELFVQQYPEVDFSRIVHVVSETDSDGNIRYINESRTVVPYPKELDARHGIDCLYMFKVA